MGFNSLHGSPPLPCTYIHYISLHGLNALHGWLFCTNGTFPTTKYLHSLHPLHTVSTVYCIHCVLHLLLPVSSTYCIQLCTASTPYCIDCFLYPLHTASTAYCVGVYFTVCPFCTKDSIPHHHIHIFTVYCVGSIYCVGFWPPIFTVWTPFPAWVTFLHQRQHAHQHIPIISLCTACCMGLTLLH